MEAGYSAVRYHRRTPEGIVTTIALVLGVLSNQKQLQGENGEPALNLLVFNPAKEHLIGSPDWHQAFERKMGVPHISHLEVLAGKQAGYTDDLVVGGILPGEAEAPEQEQPKPQAADQIEQIARLCHEANRAYCAALGDNSQPAWEEAPDWQKQSAVNGVLFHLASLASGVDPSPSASHEEWLKQKEKDGWKYGPVKDPEKKEHPCFVPYDELPAEQRAKVYIFAAIVKNAAGNLPPAKEAKAPKAKGKGKAKSQ